MKKNKTFFYGMLLGGVLFTALFFLVPGETKAAGEGGSVTIDGVEYSLSAIDSGWMGRATLDSDSNYKEVYVRNEVEFNGEYYPVGTFNWEDEEFYDYDTSTVGWNTVYRDDTNPIHDALRKITFAPDITVEGRAINFKQLEEVSFEGKISYTDGVYYYNCPKLKTVTLPSSYWEPIFGMYRIDIKKCPSVTIMAEESNPYYRVIDNDVYSKDGKTLYNVTNNTKKYRVRDGVIRIEEYAFNGNDQIRSVTMPDSVTYIGSYAFATMDNLSSVQFSKSLKTLKFGIFFNSNKIKKLNVPKKVKKFETDYGYDNSIRKIIIHTKKIKKGEFISLSRKCKAYVKNEKVKKQLRKNGFKGTVIVKKSL